jgi:hypothetical protein
MPLPGDDGMVFDAVLAKLQAAIAARVSTQCSLASCETSWTVREELGGLSEAEIGHRQKAVHGYKAALERQRAEEDRWWGVLQKTATGR